MKYLTKLEFFLIVVVIVAIIFGYAFVDKSQRESAQKYEQQHAE